MKQPGVVIGIVRDVDDPSGEGRVQLEFPWLPGGTRSAWAAIAAPLAGKERGFWFMPEIDDEVLVAFEHGQFDHPFVIGHLWNGVDLPPDTDVEHRVLVTPGGHELRFEDNEDGKQVILQTAGGHKVTMVDKSGETAVKVQTTAGHSVALDDTGQSVTVKTAGSLSLTLNDAAQSIVLSGGGRSIAMSGGLLQIT